MYMYRLSYDSIKYPDTLINYLDLLINTNTLRQKTRARYIAKFEITCIIFPEQFSCRNWGNYTRRGGNVKCSVCSNELDANLKKEETKGNVWGWKFNSKMIEDSSINVNSQLTIAGWER